MANTSRVLGFAVAKATMGQCVGTVLELVRMGQGQIVTANAEILYAAQHNERLGQVLHSAELVTADGMGVVLASRVLGNPVPERVAGADLTHALARACARAGFSWYLLGAAPEVVEKARLCLQDLYPTLRIVGARHGYFADEETPRVIADIVAAAPDLLVVAMGLRQEFWIADNKSKLPCPAIGVGGTLDIIAGVTTRAPVWMQRMGLEWSHRLVKEPQRLWRMIALPKFMGAVLLEKFKR